MLNLTYNYKIIPTKEQAEKKDSLALKGA